MNLLVGDVVDNPVRFSLSDGSCLKIALTKALVLAEESKALAVELP